jgi:hypothetical protein
MEKSPSILEVDFILKYKICVCKIFTIFDEGDSTTSRNKK